MTTRMLVVFSLIARISHGLFVIRDLTEDDFDEYVQQHHSVMVDFVEESDKQTKELSQVRGALQTYGMSIPLARVNVDQQPALAKRYFTGCNKEKQLCVDSFPRLRWFANGTATKYHRSLDTVQDIFSFTVALNRDPIRTVVEESELHEFNRYLLFRGERSSAMYNTLKELGSRHLDTLAVAHIEELGPGNVSWIVNQTATEEYAGDASRDAVEAWLRRHFTFGEELPEKPVDEDGVTVVVASTFPELVLGNDKDVFLFVYAPWCGYSRKVFPEWTKFAEVASDISGLVIAKMNGDMNLIDTQEYKWTAFPTFVYFKAGIKEPLVYEGNRTVQAFEAFARRHSPNPSGEGMVLLQPQLRGRRHVRKESSLMDL